MLEVVAEILKCRSGEGWLVGGSVRDRILGRYSPDSDVVVADDAAAVARQVAAALKAPWFALSERYPTYRVMGPGGHVDVATVRGGSILADLAQRDFTVNAMAVPLASIAAAPLGRAEPAEPGWDDVLLDPFGGAAHLRQKRLVAVSDRIFADDPLRLMRAPRFCHALGLTMDDSLARMVRAQARDLSLAAVERVVNEMCLTLASGRSSAAVALWDDLGLLAVVLPELAEGPPFAVTLAGLEGLDEMLDRLGDWFPEETALLRARLDEPVDGAVDRAVALRWAWLLRTLGAEGVRTVGRRLKVSGALVSLLAAASRCLGATSGHGDKEGGPSALADLLPDGSATARPAVLFLWDAAPWEPEVVLLAAAGRGEGLEDSSGAARRLMALALGRSRGDLAPCPVDGEVLMRELGLESGPALGGALRAARLAWEAGEAKTPGELLAVAQTVVS